MAEDLSASSSSGPDEAANLPAPIDTSVPHSARIWNYWLGGTDFLRTPEQFAARFEGLELVEPGVVPHTHWRPASTPDGGLPAPVDGYCGVGRKR